MQFLQHFRTVFKIYRGKKEEIIRAYQERSSLRGVQRIFGLSRTTLLDWLKKISKLPKIEETLKEPEVGDTVEADEIWSFVGNKKNKVWLWLALSRRTWQIIAFFIGDRTAKSCKKLWKKIPENFKQKAVFATDLFEAYNAVFPKYKHYSILKESGETTHI